MSSSLPLAQRQPGRRIRFRFLRFIRLRRSGLADDGVRQIAWSNARLFRDERRAVGSRDDVDRRIHAWMLERHLSEGALAGLWKGRGLLPKKYFLLLRKSGVSAQKNLHLCRVGAF